jgi:hypothetical protein
MLTLTMPERIALMALVDQQIKEVKRIIRTGQSVEYKRNFEQNLKELQVIKRKLAL